MAAFFLRDKDPRVNGLPLDLDQIGSISIRSEIFEFNAQLGRPVRTQYEMEVEACDDLYIEHM
jgi:hypothetical protein